MKSEPQQISDHAKRLLNRLLNDYIVNHPDFQDGESLCQTAMDEYADAKIVPLCRKHAEALDLRNAAEKELRKELELKNNLINAHLSKYNITYTEGEGL